MDNDTKEVRTEKYGLVIPEISEVRDYPESFMYPYCRFIVCELAPCGDHFEIVRSDCTEQIKAGVTFKVPVS